MKRSIFFAAFLTFCVSNVFGDYHSLEWKPKKKKKTFFEKENILIGPGIGFGAVQNAFSLNLSPSIAYSFSPYFYAGVTLGFNYYQEKYPAYNFYTNKEEVYRYKIPSYQFSAYARAILGQRFILNFEPMIMNVKNYTTAPYSDPVTKKLTADSYRLTIPALLVGAGYCQKYSEHSHLYYMLCYDAAQNPNSPFYGTLAVRVGLMLALYGDK